MTKVIINVDDGIIVLQDREENVIFNVFKTEQQIQEKKTNHKAACEDAPVISSKLVKPVIKAFEALASSSSWSLWLTLEPLSVLYRSHRVVYQRRMDLVGLFESVGGPIAFYTRRAHGFNPITDVQMEWSLWTRDIEEEILPLCRELGIQILPYNPLSPSFFSGKGVLKTVSTVSSLNYLKWSQIIKTILKGKGKISHLTGDASDETDPKFKSWDEEDSMIMAWLWNSTVPEISDTCMFLKSAKEI
ncbi:uncharacterized protein LOC128196618 [Vigna angularis]|uniref:uncharacterized protein LOC128196618 n=1 Tax=Phaseolus angularis TaxID=3914 RepID=UPI0022B4B52F|nr:uncharacterized protein LOC128196618 [Vigna angularis]